MWTVFTSQDTVVVLAHLSVTLCLENLFLFSVRSLTISSTDLLTSAISSTYLFYSLLPLVCSAITSLSVSIGNTVPV